MATVVYTHLCNVTRSNNQDSIACITCGVAFPPSRRPDVPSRTCRRRLFFFFKYGIGSCSAMFFRAASTATRSTVFILRVGGHLRCLRPIRRLKCFSHKRSESAAGWCHEGTTERASRHSQLSHFKTILTVSKGRNYLKL